MTTLNSDQVYAIIDQIARTPGKNDKQAIIAQHIGDPTFKFALVAALDPLTTYGMAKRPVVSDNTRLGGGVFDNSTLLILDDLRTRKLTGNNAIETVRGEMERLSLASAELFWRIIAKDLRAGFGESTVNKVAKGTIRDFPYMRCSLPDKSNMDDWIDTEGGISQEKSDGMFLNIDHETTGIVALSTRAGTPIPLEALGQLVDEIRARLKPGTQTHGEMLVVIDGQVAPREIGNGILNSIAQGGTFEANQQPLLKVWDQIPLTAVVPKGKHTVPYIERVGDLFKQLLATPSTNLTGALIRATDTRIVKSKAEAMVHCRELMAQGKEGTILKRKSAIWKDGTSKEQVKFKVGAMEELSADVDLQIAAIAPGKVGTKNEGRAGAFTCYTSCSQLKVDVTVKNEELRDHVDKFPDNYIGKIITVRANSVVFPSASSDLHSLFLPRMVEACVRLDKTVADSLQQVIDQFNAVTGTAAQLAEAA